MTQRLKTKKDATVTDRVNCEVNEHNTIVYMNHV